MDRIRYFADQSVRRGAGFGLLAIATIVLSLSFDPALALRATAILLSLEAAILWQLGSGAGKVPYRRREIWLLLDGRHGLDEGHAQQVISQVLRETQLAYARRLAGPAAACWVVDLGTRLLS